METPNPVGRPTVFTDDTLKILEGAFADGIVNYYENGMYYEINNYFYLHPHPAKYAREIIDHFRMYRRDYNGFAPGSNYILPKENILQHPRELYQRLRSYLEWTVYPGDAQLLERNLWYLWR